MPARRRRGAEPGGSGVFRRLHAVIACIPRGTVMTYGEVARAAGFPRAARLTVRALRVGEGLPWHRVVAAGGRIALPGDEGREQRLRLEIEGVTFRGARVRIDRHGALGRGRAAPRGARGVPLGRAGLRSPRRGRRSRPGRSRPRRARRR